MTAAQAKQVKHPPRGLLARPLDALVFLLPLIVFYEFVSWQTSQRVIAFHLINLFFRLFGQPGMWAPPLAVIVILLATHMVAGRPWKVHWRSVLLMYGESLLLAVPLLLLSRVVTLRALVASSSAAVHWPVLDDVALSVGAGIYEELVFRLVLMSLIMLIGVDLLRRDAATVAVVAVAFSALLFAAHHHKPMGEEDFDLVRFTFRTLAGVYLAGVFWFRGYGPAAGCHAAYNVMAVSLGP